jgi:hypothetical protein
MASVKWSGLVSGIVGSLNGSVFFRNRYGSVVRNNTTPINNHTPADEIIRGYIYYLSKHWQDLTFSQRANWEALALLITHYNPWGDPYHPTGYNLYISCNVNLACIGLPYIEDAPNNYSPVLPGTWNITANLPASELFFNWSPAAHMNNTLYEIYASTSLSQGKNYARNQYRIIDIIAWTDGAVVNLWSSYVAKFGVPVSGKKLFFKIKPIDIRSGLPGMESYDDIINPILSGIGYMQVGSTFTVF